MLPLGVADSAYHFTNLAQASHSINLLGPRGPGGPAGPCGQNARACRRFERGEVLRHCIHGELVNCRFQFEKRRQLFIRTHNKNVFRRRDARRQSRSFALRNPTLRGSPNSIRLCAAIVATVRQHESAHLPRQAPGPVIVWRWGQVQRSMGTAISEQREARIIRTNTQPLTIAAMRVSKTNATLI